MSMIKNLPFKLLVEFLVFVLLCIPGILWACLKKLSTSKQKSVNGQVVLITGAARGLGRELAVRFGKLDAKVACVDIEETGNHETAKMIKSDGGVAASYKCDVSNKDQIKELHAQIRDDLGPVDVLINNAAIVWGSMFIDPNDQFVIDMINVNLMGQIWMTKEILPSMITRNKGHIVAISSMSSLHGVPGISTYTITKCGINGMMECLNKELKEEFNSDVKTTTVLPYFIQTNPKISELLDIRIPEIPTEVAGELIIKGILEEQRIFSVPGDLFYMSTILRLLPDNLQAMFYKIAHVKCILDANAVKIIKKYKQTNTCSN